MKSSLLGKAAAVLEAVCTVDHPVAIKELTQLLNMPLPTVSRLCGDLVETGLLEKTDYHHIIPGITLMRFGHRAQKLSPLINTLKQHVDDYAKKSGLNAAVHGYDRGCFFHIHSCNQNNPVQDPLRYTGAFLVILAAMGIKSDKAQKIVTRKFPDMQITEKVICDREYEICQNQRTLTRIAPNRRWMITMPFFYNKIPCAISFYGIGKDERTIEAEIFDITKVVSRVNSGLDRIGKGLE